MKVRSGRVAAAVLLWVGATAEAQVLLNEAVASNVTGLTDDEFDRPDWLELHNPTLSDVDLTGWGLTDGDSDPFEWVFPSVTIASKGYLIVYLSGKDRFDLAEGVFHANFELAADGETVRLHDASAELVDELGYEEMYADDSIGRSSGGGLTIFREPTPGEVNDTEGRPGYAAMPEFSLVGGSYALAPTVGLTASSPTATLRYTLDAEDPTEDDAVYASPVTLDGPVATLRARAFEDGLWPSRIGSHTYFVAPEFDLPLVSVIVDPDDFDFIYDFPNYFQDREVPAHLEFVETAGAADVSVSMGLKIHGFVGSLLNDQRSLRAVLRGGYGDDEIVHPMFGEGEVDTFKRLILRNSGSDWCIANLRDPIVQALLADEDLDHQSFRPAVAFLNGGYWGVYNIRDKFDKFWFEENYGIGEGELDLLGVVPFSGGTEVIEGDTDAYFALLDFVEQNDLNDPAVYAQIESLVDVAEYQNYQILEIFVGNVDWPANNSKWWRPRTEDGRWRWIVFDTDFGLGLESGPPQDTLATALSEAPWNKLFPQLAASESFRNGFVNRYADLLNTSLRPDRTVAILRDIYLTMASEMPGHFLRWGCGADWTQEMLAIKDYLERRPSLAASHVIDNFGLPGSFLLQLDVSPPGAGSIELTAISIDEPFAGRYFLGVPVDMTAVAEPGWQFVGWSDASLPAEPSVQLAATGDTQVVALFAAAGEAVIHEINYNSAPELDPEDWVELHNPGLADLDLSGWALRDEDDADPFVLPEGTTLAAGGYLVLARDAAAFSAVFPGVPVLGDLPFGLGSGSDSVRLFDAADVLVDGVDYEDGSPWPSEPDGDGPTLELVDPRLDNADPASWAASVAPYGTPGAVNRTP